MAKPLPPPEVLARLVSTVTSTLFGIRFQPVPGLPSAEATSWKSAVLPILGPRPLTVGLCSDALSRAALSAAMFSCAPAQVDFGMEDDSLRELANMTAGLVKATVVPDQLLGLAHIRTGRPDPQSHAMPRGQAVMVKADQLGLFLWVREGVEEETSCSAC